jgi:hypothetical protein
MLRGELRSWIALFPVVKVGLVPVNLPATKETAAAAKPKAVFGDVQIFPIAPSIG